MEAYAAGLNQYAALHPKKVYDQSIFPITPKSLTKGFLLGLSFMTNVQFDLLRIFDNKVFDESGNAFARGSNAFAMNKNITKDGETYIAINSHQPLKGAYAWYECQIRSGEGWNVHGATFPGGPMPFLGNSEHHAWAHTVSYPDLHDVYELEMHPSKKLHYKYDGEWHELEKRKVKLKVKLGFIKIPISKTYYWSKYGATAKNKQGFFSIRHPSRWAIQAGEQWYRLNKAQNLAEFKAAFDILGIPGMNTIYADKEHNLFYISQGLFPYRDPQYKWETVLDGTTSKTNWTNSFMPVDSMVQVLNPSCGYIYNCNNSPFNSTCDNENPIATDYNSTMGYHKKNTARAVRFQELMQGYDSIDYADFKKIKFDLQYPDPFYTRSFENLEGLFNFDGSNYPDIKSFVSFFNAWDRTATIDNQQASIASLMINYHVKLYLKKGTIDGTNNLTEAEMVAGFRFAQKHLRKHFGSTKVPLGDLQKHVRGDKVLPMWGLPEMIAAMNTKPYKKGMYESDLGESYIQLVKFGENGMTAERVNCYGSSNNPNSPHYNDQMEMFLRQELRPIIFNKATLLKTAEKVYHPK
ncbi:UNVERIFIED_CONTAM: hypothetical protein GTU68_033691 [Idotea baltica]|nr:hypothetical protein [Idotea baltica]